MNELKLAKMMFLYEEVNSLILGEEDALNIFKCYSDTLTKYKGSFYKWLDTQDLVDKWIDYRLESNLDSSYEDDEDCWFDIDDYELIDEVEDEEYEEMEG